MAKKSKAKPKEPMFISLNLPVDGNFPRKGTILVRHGDLAVLHGFQYRSMRDILDAINGAVDHQLVVAENPPQIPALSATAAATVTTPASAATVPDPAASDAADESAELADEGGEPTDEGGEEDFDAPGEQPDMLFEQPDEALAPGEDPAGNFAATSVEVSQATLF